MIEERELLLMPNRKSLVVLGDKAKIFFGRSDGDLLLGVTIGFNDDEIKAALKAGGKIVTGYTFDYHCSISLRQAGVKGWCAYPGHGYGLALTREVAERVSAVSRAEFIADIQRCYAERERKWRERGLI
jgi:hypothetical protein